MNGNPSILKCLLKQPELNVFINKLDDDGNTHLHLAVNIHDFGIVMILLNMGADAGVTNKEGVTALDMNDFYRGLSIRKGILRAPAPVSIKMPGNARDEVSTKAINGEPGQLPILPSDALVNPTDSSEATVTTVAASDVNSEKEGIPGLSSAPFSEVCVFAGKVSMATLES
ncbi:hypothetical protein AAC387_Pa10g0860 [Persea americana]